MSYLRHQRVESLLKEELNKVILKEVEFSGALVTITDVVVQKDLDYALVKVSVLPTFKGDEVIRLLDKARFSLRHILLRKINIKPMPELRFEIDIGLEKAAGVEKALIEIEKKEKTD